MILIDPPNAAGHGRLWSHLASDQSYEELHAFAAGRSAILLDLLAKPTLFHTAHARAHWEAPARANVEQELSVLASGGAARP